MMATPSDLSLRRKANSRSTSETDSAVVRLVEHQHPGVLRNRLGDFGQLPLAGAEIADQRLRIDLDLQHVEECLGPAFRSPVVDQTEGTLRLAREEDVLRHRQRRNQTHLLEDHGDARAARSLRRVLREWHAVDLDRARIGHVHAAKDLQDGRLSGTVAAEQRMNLALLDLEIHIDESLDAAEGFGYARSSPRRERARRCSCPDLHPLAALAGFDQRVGDALGTVAVLEIG